MSAAALLLIFGVGLVASPATARPRHSAVSKEISLEVRVIEAKHGNRLMIDKKLKALARDLKSLPFREYALIDRQEIKLKAGARMRFEFPGRGKKSERFLVVTSKGERRGKLAFVLRIDALKFKTEIVVPHGGTILVGGPRSPHGNIIFAITARHVTKR